VISYRAIAAETSQQFNIQRLGIHTDGMGQPLKFDLRARYQDHALRAAGELDPLNIEPGQYRLTQLDARLGESDVSGTVSMRIENHRPQISADLKSGHLDTRPFQSEKPDKKQKTERIFSTRTFDLAGLRTVDADIAIQADRVTTRDALLEALTAKVVLHQGKLHIQPLTARLAGGQMSGDIALDASGQIPTLNARLELENVLPGELPTLKQKNLIREGRTNVRFTGRGVGDSAAAIAGSLNGQLLVETGRGQLLSQATDLAGGDLLFSAFQMLNPLAERESTSQLICGVLNFDIKDGTATADKGIALQTDKVNVLGSGIIDLKTEALDIRVSPKAREGLGVGLGTISDTVYIAGTLANPTPATDARSALRAAGTIGGAIATGGLSLLARGLFDRTFSASDPCAVALGKAEAGSKSPAAEEDKSTIQKATDEVRGMFRGLFDR
jgi:AsmA family protein